MEDDTTPHVALAASPVVYHVTGFVKDGTRSPDVRIATYEGKLHEVATDVLRVIQAQGYKVESHTVRTLDGWLVEVHALVPTSDDYVMWHLFTERLGDPWPRQMPGSNS